MTAWWNGNATVFDLESDGKNPEEARIITAYVGEIRAVDGRSEATPGQNWIAQPERDIPDEAAEVHGFTTERARAEGTPREEVVKGIALALAHGSADPKTGAWGAVPVVGHNLTYDCTLLDREMRRLGIGRLIDGYGGDWRVTVIIRGEPAGAFYVIDSMVLDKAIDPYRPGPKGPNGEKLGGRNTLSRVAEHYGVPIRGDAHEASADAMAAGRIAWAIAKRCAMANGEGADGAYDMQLQQDALALYAGRRRPEEVCRTLANVARLSLPELHAWQRRMAREQAESFRQYCIESPQYVREKEIDVGAISGAWPLRPMTDPSKPETVAAVAGDIL